MMTGHLFNGWKRLLSTALLILAAVAFLPSLVHAEVLLFRNDTKAVLVVQGACVINGKLKRDQPMLVQPGGFARVILPGDKLINVYDARLPNVSLFQGTLPGGTEDQAYSMQPDQAPGKLKMERLKNPLMPPP